MIVYRISSAKYATKLDGLGAKGSGGRWNSIGTAVIYTSQNLSTSIIEKLAHTDYANIPDDMMLVKLQIDESASRMALDINDLPDNWKQLPPGEQTQLIGDAFVTQEESLILYVPSALAISDYNILINPLHPEFRTKIEIIDIDNFSFSDRLTN